MIFQAKGFCFDLERSLVMGILNVTPDSFSDGGQYFDVTRAINRAMEMEREGADLIDVGAQSTRPGYVEISPQAELERLIPVLRALKKRCTTPLSVDTYFPEVAEAALLEGAHIVNDVSGLKDQGLLQIVAKHGAGIILLAPVGADQVKGELERQCKLARGEGIAPDAICVDVGIGFGKSQAEDARILRTPLDFVPDGYPVLVGASNKRVTGAATDRPIDQRLYATIAAHAAVMMGGANIIRAHDVRAAVDSARMIHYIWKGAQHGSDID